MAQDNPSWGYTRIQGALANLGHEVARGTIANILKQHGIEPAPGRKKRTAWSTFLKAHWEGLAAADFLTVEVMTWAGLVTHYVLFVMELPTRAVHIAGITTNPNDPWVMQVARNLTDTFDGFLREKSILLLDRDAKYSEAFRRLIEVDGIKIIRLPPRSPNLNAFAERFVRAVPRPSVNVWHVPCAKRLRSRGVFFCRDRPAAERRHNDSTPGAPTPAIAGSSPALRFPWLIGRLKRNV